MSDDPTAAAMCRICPAVRSPLFSLHNTLTAFPLDCCRHIFGGNGAQAAQSVSVYATVLLLSPLHLLQDFLYRVPILGRVVDFAASICERAVMSLALNIWLSIVTVIPRLVYEMAAGVEKIPAGLLQIVGVLAFQPVVEVLKVVSTVLSELLCLLTLSSSARVSAATYLAPAPEPHLLQASSNSSSVASRHSSAQCCSRQESVHDFARVFVFDDLEHSRGGCQSWFLGFTWKAALLAACRDRFTHVVRGSSWTQVFRELRQVAEVRKIAEVQFAGHGYPGGACISEDHFTLATLQENSEFRKFVAARPFTTSSCVKPIWWFRTCSTLNLDSGRQFAAALSESFAPSFADDGDNNKSRLRVAGHSQLIAMPNPLVSPGLVCFDPTLSESPAWEDGADGETICSLTFSPTSLLPIYTC